MTTVTLRATGNASPEVVWERYLRPSQWPGWSPSISRVETSADRIAAGVSGAVVGPLGLRVPFAVLTVDEAARTWTWRVRLAGVRLELDHTVAAVDEGTFTSLTLRGPALVVLAYRPFAQRALDALVTP